MEPQRGASGRNVSSRELGSMIGPARLTQAARRSHDLGRESPRVIVSLPPSPYNPFPQALYAGLATSGMTFIDVSPLELPGIMTTASAAAIEVVVHLHWTAWALGHEESHSEAKTRLDNAIEILDSSGDAPLLWTIHNKLPHDCVHRSLEVTLRNWVANRATRIHIMNPDTVDVVDGEYTLPIQKIDHIPHPDLWPWHGGVRDKIGARLDLGLEIDGVLVGLVGQLREYKGLDLLASSLEQIEHTVLVAGHLDGVETAIIDRFRASPNVHFIERRLGTQEFGAAISALDALLLPYDSSLNSGVEDLAIRAGIPVIASHTVPVDSMNHSGLSVQFLDTIAGVTPRQTRSTLHPTNEAARFAELVAGLSNSTDAET